MLKYLDDENLEVFRILFNRCWPTEDIPDCFNEATIVSIFKKGDIENLADYRPIALLNLCYKLYASTIKNRLAEQIDRYISKTQFGFRKKRSTFDAIDCVRNVLCQARGTTKKYVK